MGAAASNASYLVMQLIKVKIPSCHTIMEPVDTLRRPYNSMACMAAYPPQGSQQADVLLAVGARFSDRVPTNAGKFAKDSKIIHIDIDPAEINKM